MKGYRAGIYLLAGLVVAGCQSPATLGGQPEPTPLRTAETSTSTEDSTPPAEGTSKAPDVRTTTTAQQGKPKSTTKKSDPPPKVLGIPIGYKPEATTIHFDAAYDVFKRKLKEFAPCDDSLCGVTVRKVFAGENEDGKECIVTRWEAVNSGNRTIAYNAYIQNPCKKYNPKAPVSSVTSSSKKAP
ncbi:hypothetical protein AB5J62_21020 [Amycolatopsis sp. cg5]|uniref:hypothetical protein n=1 Tax=Amycolatopsis sp. cg5 TaxID=3238802 RepID=UPI0035246401